MTHSVHRVAHEALADLTLPLVTRTQRLACGEDSCRILSQLICSGRSPVAAGRLVVR
jgi:hypothetical protein